MSQRFEFINYDDISVEKQKKFRELFEELELLIEELPKSRYQSLFLTSIEESYAWANKAIRDNQIERDIKKFMTTPVCLVEP